MAEKDRNDSLSAIFVFSVCQFPLTCLISILLTLSCQSLPSLFTLSFSSFHPFLSLPVFLCSTHLKKACLCHKAELTLHPRQGVGQRLPPLFPPAEYSIRCLWEYREHLIPEMLPRKSTQCQLCPS